ncbi:hypothetical protein [Gemmatimonas sp.]|jgi:hypothetical protein|uniref:hypothetical protein n=1 Tax=Gemmatimonas sp. TaxID=1962908 RepID=UPI0037BECFA6
MGSFPPALQSIPTRAEAARTALALCAGADALAREVEVEVASIADDHRLFALLEQREVMLQDLAEQLVVLRLARPTADSALFASTERVVDEAEALVADVCTAVHLSHRITVELAAKVGRRAEELRAELDDVQRATTAGMAYGVAAGARLVDRRR